jgi:hypothetical protein
MVFRRNHKAESPKAAGALLPLLLGIVPSLSLPAQAESFHENWAASAVTCFARSYDSRHLASHPLQRLTRFSVRESTLGNPNRPGWFTISLSFTLKGDPQVFQSEGFCEDASGMVHCHVEADGGRFTMRADGSGLLLNIERIEVEGPQDFSPDLGAGGDDRVVRLFPSPRTSCPDD